MPAAGLFLAWLLGYVVVKGAASVATIESGSYWRLVMPALPAFALLTAAIPLLVPTFVDRMGSRLAPLPGRGPGLRTTVAIVAVLAVVPRRRPPRVRSAAGRRSSRTRRVPSSPGADRGRHRRAGRRRASCRSPFVASAGANELAWTDSTKRARTFYRVYRSSPSTGFSDMVCEPRGVDRCDLRAETLVTTRDRRYVDREPPADAVYRIGVAANWLDETDRGDVFAISPPVAP